MSNLHNETCYKHNISYHPVDGCPACEEEPAMLKHTLAEAKATLTHIEKVRASYEHRIDVVQGYIDELQNTLDVLHSEHQDIEEMERSLEYDMECVRNDEPPPGYHLNELYDNEFCMPEPVPCDCHMCRLEAHTKMSGLSVQDQYLYDRIVSYLPHEDYVYWHKAGRQLAGYVRVAKPCEDDFREIQHMIRQWGFLQDEDQHESATTIIMRYAQHTALIERSTQE